MFGVVTGAVVTVFFICIIVFKSRHLELEPKASCEERMAALKKSFWGLLLPIVVVGGIYTGAFTPTEAAAVGTVYSLFITFCMYKTLKISDMPVIMRDTVKTTCMIFAIMIGAKFFGFVLTSLQAPQAMTTLVAGMNTSP